jgi:hypothetical protein
MFFTVLTATYMPRQAVKNLQCSPLTMRRYTLAFIPFRQNLLRQGETSKVDARDTSRAAVSEAGLRAELGVVTAQKNESLGQAEGHKRKATLYEDELRQVKTKLARVVQEKIRIERDHRATLSLAKSFDRCVIVLRGAFTYLQFLSISSFTYQYRTFG